MPNELTNPNNVVTEERLTQFYQQILPYLGGMPDVLANKFNRADLYSTDEKLIGRWIDGKPLYQKTFTGTTPSAATGSVATNLTGVDKAFLASAYVLGDEGYTINIGYKDTFVDVKDDGSSIFFYLGTTHYRSVPYYVTLQYTKTTDSAVEIGDDTDYSTTEKIVGTWIDGKPIYQKTVEISNPSNTWSPVTLSSLGIENSELVFKVDSATFITSTGDIIGEHAFGGTSYATCMVADNSSGSSSVSNCLWLKWSTSQSMSKVIVTLRYTKTSS